MKTIIAPSLMCSDFRQLEREMRLFERLGVELLHLDVMDGHFVPNITMGPPLIRAISAMTDLPLDIHLMVTSPDDLVGALPCERNPIISVHVEASPDVDRSLRLIRSNGARPGVAINPATPVATIEPILHLVDLVLVMTVNPGFAGQKLVPHTIRKIAEVKKLLQRKNLSPLIEVDGNVSLENIPRMVAAGASVIVGGSSSLYRKDMSLEQSYEEISSLLSSL